MEYLQTLRNLAYLLIQLICLLHHFCFVDNFQTHKIANLTCNHRDLYIKGSVIFAGLFPIHHTRHNKTSSGHSKGKFSIGGFTEAMAMIYALGRINNDSTILPGITIGTEIIDTWSSVDVAIGKCLNLSFVKENMEARTCQQKRRSEKDPRTVVIIGSGSTDVAMAVTDLAGLFRVPVIGYASSSRLLSNRARFRYFLRTVSSDTLMARAVIDVLRALKWNFIHAMYSDTDYGRSAIETFQHVLAESTDWKICIAVRKAVSKHTRQREMNDFIAEIQAAHNLKAKAVLLFTTLKDTKRILKHFENLKKKDYVFISTDHYFGSTSKFRSSPEMLRRIVGVIPKQRLYDHPFLNYIELFKKDSFNCPWISESTGEPDFSQSSTYTPYVIDAVKAAALGLHQLLNCSKGERCQFSEEDFPALNRNDGFLKSIQNVQFKGESRDEVSFDSNGNGVGAYDITVVNTDTERWIPIGNWVSNTSNVHDIPANAGFLDINLTKLEMLWKKVFNSSHELTSVCGKKCPPGHFMNLEERYPSCCWKCVPCSTNEISNYPVNTSCQSCSALYRPNGNHSHCLPMTPTSVKLCDPAGIAICVVSIIGIIIVFFIVLVIYRNRNTHIMQASNRTLNYVLLFGIFLGYVTAPLPLLERTATLCAILLFTFSISFCIIVAALFIKTNRIYRVFSKSTTRKGTTSCVSDRWMLLFLAIFVSIETAICLFIVSTTPTSDATHVLYSDVNNEAYLQCRLASYTNYNMALWWSYNAGIVVVCTYQALLTRNVPGNNNEARFIAFNMMTISAEILIFFFCYYATNTFYRDILTSSFLIVMDTVTIVCTFLPKAYVIMFRPEKNGAQRSEKNPATFKESSNSDEK